MGVALRGKQGEDEGTLVVVGRKAVAQPPDQLVMGARLKAVLEIDVGVLDHALDYEVAAVHPVEVELQLQSAAVAQIALPPSEQVSAAQFGVVIHGLHVRWRQGSGQHETLPCPAGIGASLQRKGLPGRKLPVHSRSHATEVPVVLHPLFCPFRPVLREELTVHPKMTVLA